MRMMMKSVTAGALVSLATVAVPGAANAVVCGTSPGFNDLGDFTTATGASNGNSCTVGDKTFSNFGYMPNAIFQMAAPANLVTVGPATTPNGPGLLLTSGWSNPSTNTGTADAFITFAVVAPTAEIVDASLSLSGASIGVTDIENISVGVVAGGASLGSLMATGAAPNPPSLSFSPQAAIFVSDNLSVPPGLTASDLNKEFSQRVPEPASLAILGVSLLGMGAAAAGRRRFRK
jgi:hypothetical protein